MSDGCLVVPPHCNAAIIAKPTFQLPSPHLSRGPRSGPCLVHSTQLRAGNRIGIYWN